MNTDPTFLEAAHRWTGDGWTYKLVGPDLKKKETNCCIAAEQIMMDRYGTDFTRQEHADLMILDADRPWSPIDAVVSAGIGRAVQFPVAGRYHLMQRWKSTDPLSQGHTLIWYEAPAVVLGQCLIIQATKNMDDAFMETDFARATRGRPYRMAVLNL